jgi:hypothetical protein
MIAARRRTVSAGARGGGLASRSAPSPGDREDWPMDAGQGTAESELPALDMTGDSLGRGSIR